MGKIFIIKLGGSLISREDNLFDFAYLQKLKAVLQKQIILGNKFFVIPGGGATMRRYRDLAMAGGLTAVDELHWIGTHVNTLHAQILRSFWFDIADPEIIDGEEYYDETKVGIEKSLKIGGGGRPGHSSDMDASRALLKLNGEEKLFGSGDTDTTNLALKLNHNLIISLKNIDAVYTADPKKDPAAKPLKKITWNDYFNIIGNVTEHAPGANFPVDPVTAKLAQKLGITFYIILGTDLENFAKVLEGQDFSGTIISNA